MEGPERRHLGAGATDGGPTERSGRSRSGAPGATAGPRWTPAAAAALVGLACGGEGAELAETVVRDSAGVAIVENPGGAVEAADRWRVDPEPLVDVGVVEGAEAYQLSDVTDAALLSDGRIAVANGGTQEVRYYDPEGRHLRSVGGEGGGPGEFQGLSTLDRLAGDSLLAYDFRQGRASLLGPDGEFVESHSFEGLTFSSLRGRLANDTLLLQSAMVFGSGGVTPRDGTYQDSVVLLAADRRGTAVDTFRRFLGPEYYMQTSGRGFRVGTLPLGRRTVVAVGDDRVYAGYSGRYEVRAFDPRGEPVRIVRLAAPARPVTEEVVERVVDERLEGIEDEDRRREMRSMYEKMPAPEALPAFEAMAVDEAGRLWVKDFSLPGEAESQWTVFGREGRVVATAVLPSRFTPYEIGEDRVLGRWRDELDVEHVRLYRLVKE